MDPDLVPAAGGAAPQPPEPTSEDIYTAEFDIHPGRVGRIILRADEKLDLLLLAVNGEEHVMLKVLRDMWGAYVWVDDGLSPVAQEDETRSMLAALIEALELLRSRNEHETTAPTVTRRED